MDSNALVPVTTESFREKALAIPDAVERFLAMNPTSDEVKNGMDYTALQAEYAKKIKADTKVINAIVYGRLKLIARWAKLNPAITPEQSGAMGGRGNKGCKDGLQPFSRPTESAYRKVGDNEHKIDEYQEHQTEKKPDDEMSVAGFIRFATGTEKAGTAAHVSENTGVPEWYTPQIYIEAAQKVLGEIDLDPATSEIAQKTVQASKYYTVDDDGLAQNWVGRVWMNPPYSSDLVTKFANKLCDHYEAGDVPAAIMLVNNATDTRWLQQCLSVASAVCFPAGRIKFLDEESNPGAPLQGQVFVYFGSDMKLFSEVFGDFGVVLVSTHVREEQKRISA